MALFSTGESSTDSAESPTRNDYQIDHTVLTGCMSITLFLSNTRTKEVNQGVQSSVSTKFS